MTFLNKGAGFNRIVNLLETKSVVFLSLCPQALGSVLCRCGKTRESVKRCYVTIPWTTKTRILYFHLPQPTPCFHSFQEFPSMYSFPKRILSVHFEANEHLIPLNAYISTEKYNLNWCFISLFLAWKRTIMKGRLTVYNILLDINMIIWKKHF